MRQIDKWITAGDEKARKSGFPEILTGGEIKVKRPEGVKYVQFREEIKHGGKLVKCCLAVDTRPELAALVAEIEAEDKAERAQTAEIAKRTARIYLSSRGWGDYSACECVCDITLPDDEILAECKHALATGHDVDQPNQTDEEIMSKIKDARDKWETAPARKAAREAADIKRKIDTGYCFSCDSWCDGDCGHYSNDPRVMYRRQFNEAAREANYGFND